MGMTYINFKMLGISGKIRSRKGERYSYSNIYKFLFLFKKRTIQIWQKFNYWLCDV